MANIITLKSDGRPTGNEPGRLNAFYGDAVVGYVITPVRINKKAGRDNKGAVRAFLVDGDVEVGSFKDPQTARTQILHAYLAACGLPLPRRGRPLGSKNVAAPVTTSTAETAETAESEIVTAE